ncbi:MAG: hypothetical protein Kow00121_59350 [Elainellaceae cyanobacterium]
MKRNSLLWFVFTLFALPLIVLTPSAQANCANELDASTMTELRANVRYQWQALQEQTTYPWGTARVYDTLVGDRITLTSAFDQLSGIQKQEALSALKLFGTSYRVYDSSGRLVSVQNDGCTRFTLLTERDRFRWYHNHAASSLPAGTTLEALRNAGTPDWRIVNYSISPEREQAVRLRFWNAIGFEQEANDWWISWVPELGYFEINVPPNYPFSILERFFQIAHPQYRYVIVTTDGTILPD